MQPNDQTSLRRSTGLPRACSGLMYAAVPSTVPSTVRALIVSASGEAGRSLAASPKSSTLATPGA
jgi:hypothetical protein